MAHNNEGVDNKWSNIECAIINATSQIIGKMNPRRNDDWFDQECADAIIAKNIARKRMLQRHIRHTQDEYNEKRRIAKRL